MRRLLLLLLLALLIGAGLFRLLDSTTGFIMLVVGHTSITVSIWVGLALLVAAILLLWLLSRLLRGSWHLGNQVLSGALFGGKGRAQRRTMRGMLAFIEGNWPAARRLLLLGAPRAETPLLNYVAAARCAAELGDQQQASQLLHLAATAAPTEVLTVALILARIQLQHQHYEQCVATLERVRKLAPKHPVLLNLLVSAWRALPDWAALAQLLPLLKRYRAISIEEYRALVEEVYVNLLGQVVDNALQADRSSAATQLNTCWRGLTRAQRQQPAVLNSYVTQLRRIGDETTAEAVLRKSVGTQWGSAAIIAYGLVQGDNPQQQLRVAEDWLKDRPTDAELLLTLGRLSLRNQLWGKARDYFDRSLQQKKLAETYAEQARLLANLGEHQLSAENYQKGLLLQVQRLPDLPQPMSKNLP